MSALPTVDRADAALARLLLSATSVDMDVRAAADDAAREHAALTKKLFGTLELFERQWNACGPNSEFGRHFQSVRDAVVSALAKADPDHWLNQSQFAQHWPKHIRDGDLTYRWETSDGRSWAGMDDAVDHQRKLSSGNGQQISDTDLRVGGIVGHLKDCADAAQSSGSDFNQGVVRGLEIAVAQIEGRHDLDRAFGFQVEDAEKPA